MTLFIYKLFLHKITDLIDAFRENIAISTTYTNIHIVIPFADTDNRFVMMG